MFNLKRNQVIITVLVFMIAIAAYLNTQEMPNSFKTTEVAAENNNIPEEVDFFEGYNEQLTQAGENVQNPDLPGSSEVPVLPVPTQTALSVQSF